MATQNYDRPFTYSMRDGTVRTFKRGEQDVPDEVAESSFAQAHLVDAPLLLTPHVYGTLGHEVQAFEQRDLGPAQEELDSAANTPAPATVAFMPDAEIAEPDGKGLSTRIPSSRPRISASD